jgi:1-acyl-sn-glycerol-3-phosphate acyltransferase
MDALVPARATTPGPLLAAVVRGYYAVAFYGILAMFGIVFLGWNPPATLLYRLLPHGRSARFGQRAIMAGFRFLLGLMRVTGLARFDLRALDTLRDEPGLVLAANHPTMIDIVLIASRLPRMVCIAKASLWDNAALGAGARLAGYIRNDEPHRLIRHAARAVAAGSHLLIFPEGTRTTDSPVGPMKAGFALMARQAGVPVQTVLLEPSSPYLCKGWGLLRQPRFPLIYRARLGRRFVVEGGAEAFTRQIEAYFRAELGGS